MNSCREDYYVLQLAGSQGKSDGARSLIRAAACLRREVWAKFRGSGQLPGVGISGMRERMNALRGTFEVTSDDSGTTIRASVPIRGGG
jgi:hypothetical protein